MARWPQRPRAGGIGAVTGLQFSEAAARNNISVALEKIGKLNF